MNLRQKFTGSIFFLLTFFSAQSLAEIQVIARTNQAAADFPSGVSYSNFFEPVIGSSGHIAFIGSVVDSENNNTRAVWAGLPGQLKAVIKENETPIGFPGNMYLGSGFHESQPVLTQSGAVGILVMLEDDSFRKKGVLAHIDGTTFGIMKVGDQAPGFPEGFTVSDILDFAFTDAGMVIVGSISGFELSGRRGIWYWNALGIQLIPSPVENCHYGHPRDIVSINPMSHVSINQAGDVVFTAALVKDDNSLCSPAAGVFKWTNGSVKILVSQNDPVPNMPGARFVNVNQRDRSLSPVINDQGSVIFFADLTTDPDNFRMKTTSSAWVIDDGNQPKLLLLSGEKVKENSCERSISFGLFSSGNNIQSLLKNFSGDEFALIHSIPGRGDKMLLAGNPRDFHPYHNLDELGESQLTVLATTNNHSPGFGVEWRFAAFPEQAVNNVEQYVFVGQTRHSVNTSTILTGIWRGDSKNRPRLIAKEGMKIFQKGTENTLETIRWLDLPNSLDSNLPRNRYTRISDNGQIVFRGSLDDESVGIFLITDDRQEQRIFSLAEQFYPQFFSPANVDDQLLEGFVYRHYPTTNAYIGIKNGEVFVLGDAFGSGAQRIGTIESTLSFLEELAAGSE